MGKVSLTENFEEQYKITIKDKHTVGGEVSESTTELFGDLNVAKNGYIIRYTEHDGDFAGTTTKIFVIEPDSVRLSRGGRYGLDLVLERGKRHNCAYDTPYGSLQMGVYAKNVDSKMSECGGNLKFAYSLDIGGGEVSDNELEVIVKDLGKRGEETCQR